MSLIKFSLLYTWSPMSSNNKVRNHFQLSLFSKSTITWVLKDLVSVCKKYYEVGDMHFAMTRRTMEDGLHLIVDDANIILLLNVVLQTRERRLMFTLIIT